jgi:hypothetical protein
MTSRSILLRGIGKHTFVVVLTRPSEVVVESCRYCRRHLHCPYRGTASTEIRAAVGYRFSSQSDA